MEAGTPTGPCGPEFQDATFGVSPVGCCGSGAELALLLPGARAAGEEVLLASRIVADGVRQTDLSVPAVHCGGCMRTVETALAGLAGVQSARVNLSTKRATVRWRADSAPP